MRALLVWRNLGAPPWAHRGLTATKRIRGVGKAFVKRTMEDLLKDDGHCQKSPLETGVSA